MHPLIGVEGFQLCPLELVCYKLDCGSTLYHKDQYKIQSDVLGTHVHPSDDREHADEISFI